MTETASLVVPIILSFGEPFEIAIGRVPDRDDRFGTFTAGLTGTPVQIRSGGAAHCLQVDLTPLGAYRFFGRPMHELAERMVPLDDLGDPMLGALRERLGAERSWRRRFALAEAAITPRLLGGRGASAAVAWAYRSIVETGGAVRIAAIAARLAWSRKHLAARFREEVGVAPKLVARIARFDRAGRWRGSGAADGWADVAAACGFCRPGPSGPRIRGARRRDAGRLAGGRVRAAQVTFLQSRGRRAAGMDAAIDPAQRRPPCRHQTKPPASTRPSAIATPPR